MIRLSKWWRWNVSPTVVVIETEREYNELKVPNETVPIPKKQ